MSCDTILKEKGLKLTPQRRLIIDIMHNKTAQLTAEEIIVYVKTRMPGVNKSTVYRTLGLLRRPVACVKANWVTSSFITTRKKENITIT